MTAPHQSRLGKYDLRGELGRGAMGVVYRAYDRVLCRDVALKTMAGLESDEEQTQRFLREARTVGSLHHPNIVTIHELGHDSGSHFIAMELLEGKNLRELIEAESPCPIHRRIEIVARLCDGLDYAHDAGIVHRDVKPANVFLPRDGSVKILDFGIAKIAASDATRTGMLLGTVYYMSPEQVRAVKSLDGRSDIFSAGVILYELLFGRRPFRADDIGATLHRILHHQPPGYHFFDRIFPSDLADVLRRSLDKKRDGRFARAAEMARALDRIAGKLTGSAGAELQARIDEVVGMGTLDRDDAELPELETRSDMHLRSETADTAVRPRRRSPAMLVALGGAAAALVGAAWLGNHSLVNNVPDEATPEPPVIAQVERPVPPPSAVPEPHDEIGAAASEPAVTTPEPEPPAAAKPEPAPTPAPPLPRGALDLLVMPWANIEWIENLDTGERVPSDESTPVQLQLAEGRYRLRVVNPYAAGQLDVEAVVRGGETAVVRRTMPGFDAAELAGEILAREASQGERR